MSKNAIITTVISILLIGGFLFVTYSLTNKPQTSDFSNILSLNKTDHLKWSPEKKHILVEYSDMQCPACKTFHEAIKSQIESSASGSLDIQKNITFVYRFFPLYQIHPKAFDSAYAAEAADHQGKFFEMVDMLFARQNSWSKSGNPKNDFISYAKELGLDTEQYKKDMDSQVVKDKVDADLASGNKAEVNATPTFFLDGKKLDNVNSFEEFKQLLVETAKQ